MLQLTLGLAAGVMGVAIMSDRAATPSCCSSCPAIGVEVWDGGGNLAAILLLSFGVDGGRSVSSNGVSTTFTVAIGSWKYKEIILKVEHKHYINIKIESTTKILSKTVYDDDGDGSELNAQWQLSHAYQNILQEDKIMNSAFFIIIRLSCTSLCSL